MAEAAGRYSPPVPAPHGTMSGPPVWAGPVHKVGGTVLNIMLILLAACALAVTAFLLIVGLGPEAFLAAGLLALVPLGICLLGIRWIDRWEPEPRGALLFAFLWGAGASVGLTLLLSSTVGAVFAGTPGDVTDDTLRSVVQAPVLEEFTKGLGVLILAFSRRSHFDGPVDGLVYGGTVAAGFAFTENVLYFGAAYLEAGAFSGEVAFMFVMRGLFSPFAHVMFTAATGMALGLAARRPSRSALMPAFAVGLIPAIAGHMLWNGGLVFLFDSFFDFYLLLQVPLFLAALMCVWLLRRAERRLTERRLADYAAAGWFSPQEVSMLATGAGRAQAVRWARSFGAGALMKAFVQRATRLAFVRQRIITGHHPEANAREEIRLLRETAELRGRLFAQAGFRPGASA